MTVVVWDGRMLAADRRATVSGRVYTVCKVFRLDADRLIGYAGHAQRGIELVEWVRNGSVAADYPKGNNDEEWCSVLIVHRDGRIQRVESRSAPIEVLDKVHALGSGADFALGAISAGKNAAEAVEIASQWNPECGNGVDFLTFDEPEG